MKRTPLTAIAACALLLASCADEEQEQLLLQLQGDLSKANATIDSLTYSLDDSNLLLDGMRAQVDSTQRVNDRLLENAQKLNKELRQWRKLATEYKKNNEKLTGEIERLKVEKQADRQAIAQLRAEADSLNGVLLETHTSIRRQSDHIRRLEMDLAQTRDQAETLAKAQDAVHLYAAGEKYLKDNGYLQTSRPFGGGFRKQYKLIKKIRSDDPGVQLVPIGQGQVLEGKIDAFVDRYGKLKKGEDYQTAKVDGGSRITFVNDLIGGTGVLAIIKD
jgi:seryl-tRNA synthetase|tara:strand:+ start:208 stop:1032 length:825 start_codon:yes stop_codon:yes gene_type:complete